MEENQFSVNLEKIRKSNKLSQKELAEKVNVAAVTISAYEKGNKTPSLDVALRIADYFGVSLDSLCGRESSKIKTVEDFLLQFIELAKTPAIKIVRDELGQEYFGLDDVFIDLQSGLFKILELYKTGVIDEDTLDTWAKGKKREYNGTDLNVYIGIQKALELEKMTGGELMDTDS